MGRALDRVTELRDRGVKLATTDRNADECFERLVNKFGNSVVTAEKEVERVIQSMELIPAEEYEHLRGAADARLRVGGKSDWPALAAALALEAEIWSDDVDFFGVGLPVWSSANVQFVEGEG